MGFLRNLATFQSHHVLSKNPVYVKNDCIRAISETTGASIDVYCPSINDNHIRTSCAFYVETVQVKHSGELGRKPRKRV